MGVLQNGVSFLLFRHPLFLIRMKETSIDHELLSERLQYL